MSASRWIDRALAVVVVYLGWATGFALLETAWQSAAGGVSIAIALIVPLVAGAVARLLDRTRLLPWLAVAVVALDTLGAHLVGAVPESIGLDRLLRAVPLGVVLLGVLTVSAVRRKRERKR